MSETSSSSPSHDRHVGAAAQPHVGEWWRTPDGILWRVDGVGKRTVKLSTSRSYGVMKATAHRADFVRRSKRETVDA